VAVLQHQLTERGAVPPGGFADDFLLGLAHFRSIDVRSPAEVSRLAQNNLSTDSLHAVEASRYARSSNPVEQALTMRIPVERLSCREQGG
jgi:hypothetical protein